MDVFLNKACIEYSDNIELNHKGKEAIKMRTLGKGILRLLASYIAIPVALVLMPTFLFGQDVSAFDGLVNFIIGGEDKL